MSETRLPAGLRWTATRERLGISILLAVVAALLSSWLESDLRVLISYDAAILTYLVLLCLRLCNADGEITRELASRTETSNWLTLLVASLLSGCSLAGVGFMLHRSKNWSPLFANVNLGLSLLAVFLSWTLLHAVFGIHYAHVYYDPTPPKGEPPGRRPLEFPEDELPDFWDFMYFSFTLAICYQVSDISIRSRYVRRMALAHVLLSFLNVTMILGLVVEIVSTLANAR